jgi:epoxide hydrolase-like predicted phosphatase
MVKKIKAVVFDVGGVLQVSQDKEAESIFMKVSKGLNLDLDSLFDAIDTPYAKSVAGEISENEFIKNISENLGISGGKIERVFIKILKNHFTKNKELFDLAKKLKKNGYTIGILSDQWYFSKKALMPRTDFKTFDVQVISCEVGLRKPDKKIYELLIKELNKIRKISAEEIVFIDNRDYNLKPAKRMGMKTILFKDNKGVLDKLNKFGLNI